MRRSVLIGRGAGCWRSWHAAGPSGGCSRRARRGGRSADGRAVVAEVRRIIAERYVLPERRPALDAILAQGLAAGRYDVAEPGRARRADQRRSRHRRPRPPPQFQLQSAPGGDSSPPATRPQPDNSGYERQVRAANHGVTELRVLPGNVRYMAYDGFMWIGPESAAALETCDALPRRRRRGDHRPAGATAAAARRRSSIWSATSCRRTGRWSPSI